MEDLVSMIVNALRNISISACIDIVVVAFIFYKGYFLIKETRAEQLLKGIALIIVLIPISYLFNLSMLYYILSKTLAIGVLSVVIIFQPEIRRALEHLGRSAFEDKHGFENQEQRNKNVNEIVEAVINLAETKTGALIAIEQGTGLGELIASGTEIDSKISSNLLENIFVVNTPLHDGAVVISDNKIVGDLTGKLNGKGCYLKKDKEIIEEARKKKVLNHIFNMDVSDDVYETLKELV